MLKFTSPLTLKIDPVTGRDISN